MSTNNNNKTPPDKEDQRSSALPTPTAPTSAILTDRSRRGRMACTACRKRKIRCDGPGDSGSCALCIQTGQQCVFVQASRRGPPKGYVESLEQRLEAMEALLQSLSTASSQDAPNSNNSDQVRAGAESLRMGSASDGSASSPSVIMSTPAADTLEGMDALAEELDQLSVDKDRYVGRGSGLHLAHSLNTMNPTNKIVFVNEVDYQPSLVEQMIQSDHCKSIRSRPLPPPDLAHQLVEAYFSQLNSIFAVLHRPSFDRAVDSGLLDADGSFRSLYFMVCALGARFIEDERLVPPPSPLHPNGSQQSRGFELFQAATEAASPALISATLYDLQCSVLCVMWLLGSAGPITAWGAVGYAVRRVVDVGAHRERRARWTASPLEDQLRKRAFHFLFGLDRMISVGLGRPLAMQEEDFDVQQPLDISDEDLDVWNADPSAGPAPPPGPDKLTTLSCLKAFFELSSIQGQVLKQLYGMKAHTRDPQKTAEVVLHLDSLLNAWLERVPQALRWNPHEQNNVTVALSVALYCHYYSTQILVHREFLSPGQSRVVGFPSLAICSNAARSMANVLNTLRHRNMLGSAFWYAPMMGITAGLILLINVYSGASSKTNLTNSALNDVKRVINVLGVMAEDNFVARKCFVALTRLVASAADARAPDSASTASPPSATPANAGVQAPGGALKRSNPFGWLDGESPVSTQVMSSAASSSSSPTGLSPKEPEDLARTASSHRSKRERREDATLPQTTDDLSLDTFNGRPTFSFDIKSALQSEASARASTSYRSSNVQSALHTAPKPASTAQHTWSNAANLSELMYKDANTSNTIRASNRLPSPSPMPTGKHDASASVPQGAPTDFITATGYPGYNTTEPFDFDAAMAAVSGAAAGSSLETGLAPNSVAPIDALLFCSGSGSANNMGPMLDLPPTSLATPAPQPGNPMVPAQSMPFVPQQDEIDMYTSMAMGLNMGTTTPGAWAGAGPSTAVTGIPSFVGESAFDFSSFSPSQPGLTAGTNGADVWNRSMLGDFDFSAFSTFSPAAYVGESYFQSKPAALQHP